MKIKQFALASFIYIAIIAGFTFYLNLGDFSIVLGSFELNLPVVLWVILPLLIYFILAIFHLSFFAFLRYLKFKNFFSDAKKFEGFVQELLLENDPFTSFHTKEFKQVAQLTKSLKNHEKIDAHTRLNEIYDTLDGLKREEFLNLSKFKLSNTNALFIQNEKNHIKCDANYAYSKLKNLSVLNNELEELAFETLIKKGSYEQIKNVKVAKTPAQILCLIKRFKEGGLELSLAEFEVLLSKSNLSQKEFLSVAKMSVKCFNPDSILGIFAKLKSENAEAFRAYCFLLAEFGMYDELLSQIAHSGDEMADFKAVLALREKGISIDLNHFIV